MATNPLISPFLSLSHSPPYFLTMLSRSAPLLFDAPTLSLFKKRLLNIPTYKFKFKPDAKDAAVLLPLCTVNQKPSVLFTVRNLNMRTHRGEIR